MVDIATAGTYALTPSNRLKPDVNKRISELEPDANPFTLFMNQLPKTKALQPRFDCHQGEPIARLDTVNGAIASTTTSLVVDNVSRFNAGDQILITRTGERLAVTNVTSATSTLTVVRGIGSTIAAQTIDDEDEIQILGAAFEEGSAAATAIARTLVDLYNYIQVFKTGFAVTDLMNLSQTTNEEQEIVRLRKEKAIEHQKSIEYTALFGTRHTRTGTTNTVYYTGGAWEIIPTTPPYTYDMQGAITAAKLEEFAEAPFSYGAGSPQKLLFVGSRVASVMNGLLGDKLQTVPKAEVYGVNMKRFQSIHGDLLIHKHRLMTGNFWAYCGLLLDIKSSFRLKVMQDTIVQDDSTAGPNVIRKQWYTVLGLDRSNANCNAFFYNGLS